MHINDRLEIPDKPLQEWCQRWQVHELSLFGSAVGDAFTDGSDVDFLVEFHADSQVTLFRLSRMQRELSVMLSRSVDLVPKQGLKPLIREEILASAEIIYAA